MNAPQSLAELVDQALVHRGVKSGRRLAELAQDHGHRLTNTTVNAIRSGTYKFQPTAETVRAIGWLAGVSEEVAFAAAGLRVPGPPFADELPPGVDNLSPRKRKVVIELLRVLIDEEEVTGNAQHPAPTSTAGRRPDIDYDDPAWHGLPGGPAAYLGTAQDQTRETPPVRPEGEPLTEDESTDPTASAAGVDEVGRRRLSVAEARRRAAAVLRDQTGSYTPGRRPTRPEAGAPSPPADVAARDVGKPSRGQQIRERQDADADDLDGER